MKCEGILLATFLRAFVVVSLSTVQSWFVVTDGDAVAAIAAEKTIEDQIDKAKLFPSKFIYRALVRTKKVEHYCGLMSRWTNGGYSKGRF